MMVVLGIFNRMMEAISGVFKKENKNRKNVIKNEIKSVKSGKIFQKILRKGKEYAII